MPKQLAVAEYVLQQRVKVPSSLKIEKAYFSIDDGHPKMLIKYTANNSFNAPISNVAIFIYQCPSIETNKKDSAAIKLRNDLTMRDIKEISSGEKIISPFDLCTRPIIEIGNSNSELEEATNLAFYHSADIKISQSIFPPRSSIGGVVKELTENGTIKADNLIKTYTPGKLFPWE